jgi:hypothetical protein
MSKPLSLRQIMVHQREAWQKLPDYRKPNNNTQYEIVDAALAAFSVFFMPCPSFLAHQRAMQQRKSRSNAKTLFQMEKIPCDNQIRNLLDPIAPEHFQADYAWVLDELKRTGHLEAFRGYANPWLIAWDGLTYPSSTRIHCAHCSQRQDSEGTTHDYPSALTAVRVKPDCPHGLPWPPEFIVPQAGHDQPDGERAAVKRWLARPPARYQPHTVTFLGDDR